MARSPTQHLRRSIPASTGPLRLGGNSIWQEWFRGDLDDVRVYNRALRPSEIQADMNSPVGGDRPRRPPPAASDRHTQAPSAPGGPSVSGQTQTALTLNWNAATDNVGVTGYSLYRGGTAAGSNNASTRTYTFSGLSCGTTYTLVRRRRRRGRQPVDPVTASRTDRRRAPAPPQPSGLVAAYSFNGGSGSTLADSSGRGKRRNDLRPELDDGRQERRRPHLRWCQRPRHDADAASLDLTTGMTLEAWVRPTATTSWRTVVTKEQPNNLVYGLFANSDAAQPSGIVSIGSKLLQDIVRGSAPLPVSTWTHLATTYDGSQLRLFVNGSQVATRAVAGAMPNSNGPLQIGGNRVWPEWFKGQIDDVRVYNRALSASELQTDMNTPVGRHHHDAAADDASARRRRRRRPTLRHRPRRPVLPSTASRRPDDAELERVDATTSASPATTPTATARDRFDRSRQPDVRVQRSRRAARATRSASRR